MSTDPVPSGEERSDLAVANVMPHEERSDLAVANNKPREGRQPRWLMPAAVAFCAASVLIGVLLALDTLRTGSAGEPITHPNVNLLATVGPGPNGSPVPGSGSGGGQSGTPTDSAGQALAATGDTAAGTGPPPARVGPGGSSVPPPNVWVIRSVVSSLCLGADSGGKSSDTAVRQVPCDGTDSQRWRVVSSSAHVMALVNAASGKCLGLGSGRPERAAVQQEPCTDGPDQLWRVNTTRDGPTTLRSVNSDGCLEATGDKSGSVVRQSTCDGHVHQQWTIGG